MTIGGSTLDQEALSSAIKFIFSWIILLPVGVIVTGKFVTQRLKIDVGSGQLFRIPVRGIFTIEASGAEVILGFAWYMICLLLLGICVGSSIQPWVIRHFGIDPGQFNSLGFVSSLFSVAVSFLVFLLTRLPSDPAQAKRLRKRNQVISALTRKQTGIDPNKLPQVQE